MTPRPSKYRNTPTTYDGRRYDSRAEARRAADLDLLKRSGQIRHWENQPSFRLGCPENVYRADFIVWATDGTTHVEDVKGVRTAKFNRDVKLWRRYGPCDLHIISGKSLEIVTPEPAE